MKAEWRRPPFDDGQLLPVNAGRLLLGLCAGAVIVSVALSGCSSVRNVELYTDQQRARAERLELFSGTTNRPFKSLGAVNGEGCQRRTFDTNIPETDARWHLKLQAAARGADAVVGVDCQDVSVVWYGDCFKLTECSGEGVQWLNR